MVFASILILSLLPPGSVALANLFQNYVTKDLDISISSFALSNSILHGMGIFFAPMASTLLSKEFKKWHAIGILLYGISFICYGIAPNIYIFYFISLFAGIGLQLATIIPVSMVVTNWFVKKRGLAISIAMSGLGIGGTILSPIITNLLETIGWRMTYMLYGGAMLLVAIPLSLFVLRLHPSELNQKAYGEEELELENLEHTQELHIEEAEEYVKIPFQETLKQPFFYFLIIGAVFVGINNNAGFGQFPPFLQNIFGPQKAAMVISTYSLIGIIGKLTMGSINDRFGVRVTNIYQTVLMMSTYVMMAVVAMNPSAYSLALLTGVIFGFANANGTILNPLITAAIYSPADYAKVYGFVQSGMQLGMTTGSLIAAGIIQATGLYELAWITIAIISALAGIFWYLAYKLSRRFV